MASHDRPSKVVICGGGIVGVSTAYYLATRKGVAVTLVERHEVAGAASGKAGGFLALDWNDGSPVGKLARRSWQLHRELADAFGANTIGYRPLDTLSLAVAAGGGGGGKRPRPQLPGWLDGRGIQGSGVIGTPATTAQVHPQKLTRAMWAAAEAAGAQLVHGVVRGVALRGGRKVAGVEVEGRGTLPADAAVIALGPWSGQAAGWLRGAPPVGGQKAHSAVLRPGGGSGGGGGVTATAVFMTYTGSDGRVREPEIYPRPDGSVYVCGESSGAELPDDPAAVSPDEGGPVERILEAAGAAAGCLRGAALEAAQACYLPVTDDGMPYIGRVPGVDGAFVGAGHSCWGILNGPATGLALAELVADGAESTVDVAAFDPARAGKHAYGAV